MRRRGTPYYRKLPRDAGRHRGRTKSQPVLPVVLQYRLHRRCWAVPTTRGSKPTSMKEHRTDLTFSIGYTLSHALGIQGGPGTGTGSVLNNGCPRCEYGNLNTDVAHHFSLTATYTVPGRKGVAQMPGGLVDQHFRELSERTAAQRLDSSLDTSGTEALRQFEGGSLESLRSRDPVQQHHRRRRNNAVLRDFGKLVRQVRRLHDCGECSQSSDGVH